jgi:hypothetical protein
VLVKSLFGGRSELLGIGAGGVQGSQQRRRLMAHRLLDQWRLAKVLGRQHVLDAGCLGTDTALPPGLAQQVGDLIDGQCRSGGWGRRGCKDHTRFGAHDAAAGITEGRQEGRVVLA